MLQYINTEQKLNSRQASWYLLISEYIHHIHYRPGFKFGKPDGQSVCSGEEESGFDVYFMDGGQLLDLDNNDIEEEKNVEDVKLEEIDVGTWWKKNGLQVVAMV